MQITSHSGEIGRPGTLGSDYTASAPHPRVDR